MSGEEDARAVMPIAHSVSGGVAGVSAPYAIMEELVAQAHAIEQNCLELAGSAASGMQDAAAALTANVSEGSRLLETAAASFAESAIAFNDTVFAAVQAHLNESAALLQGLASARDASEALAAQASFAQRRIFLLSDQLEDFFIAAEKMYNAAAPLQIELLKSVHRLGSD